MIPGLYNNYPRAHVGYELEILIPYPISTQWYNFIEITNFARTDQNSNQIHVARVKRGKMHASKSRLVLVLLLIG